VTQTRHVWYSVLQNCGALQTNAKMGECLKYNLVTRIIAAFVGAGVGISGCVAFAKVYRNYNAAAWAALSAVFAIVFLYLHFVVRQDHERHISRLKFTVIMFIGISGLTAATIDFVVNVTLGITHHESGVRTDGYFIACVWNFLTFKWGLLTFFASRKFRKKYYDSDPQSRGLVQST